MDNVLVQRASLENAADSIRAKLGTQDLIAPEDFATNIDNIPSGGPTKDYGTLKVATNYTSTPTVSYNSNCTVSFTDTTLVMNFITANNLDHNGTVYLQYSTSYGGWYDSYYGSSVTYTTEVLNQNGFGVTLSSSSTTSASMQLSITIVVDPSTYTTESVTELMDYYSLGYLDIGSGSSNRTFMLNGITYPRAIILGFTFGPDADFVGDYFLAYCSNLQDSIIIPSTTTTIGNYFLYQCATFNNTITISGTGYTIGNNFLYGCTAFNQPLDLSGASIIGASLLSSCTTFNSTISIGGNVGSNCLNGCSAFNQNVTFSQGTNLGQYFLQNCTSFNKALDLSNVVSVGNYFLSGCTSYAQTVTLPSTLTVPISLNSFMYKCSKVTSVVVNCPAPTSIDTYSFATNTASDPMYATGITMTGTTASDWKDLIVNSSLSPYRNIIGGNTAYFVYNGNRVNLGSSIPSGFYNNSASSTTPTTFSFNGTSYTISNITEVNLGAYKSMTSMGAGFLGRWGGVTKVTLPPNITSVGAYFLYHCDNLTNIVNGFHNLVSVGGYFLSNMAKINQQFDFSNLKTVYGYFMCNLALYNQPINLPEFQDVERYDYSYNVLCNLSVFNNTVTWPKLHTCPVAFRENPRFNQPLTIPSTYATNNVGSWFYNCDDMTNVITFEGNPSNHYGSDGYATTNASANCYTQGIQFGGPYGAAMKNTYHDSSTSPYRKIILAS